MHNSISLNDPLPMLIDRRETIEAVMAQYLAGAHQGCATDEDKTAAHILFAILLAQLGAEEDEEPLLSGASVRRYAGRFGDGLVPILRDMLGADAGEAFLARCGDGYWKALAARQFA